MKASNKFKETIKEYLDKRAADDQLFAVTYSKKNKNLDECCNYIVQCAKEGKHEGYDPTEVFGWAVHYYDEDDIKNIKPIACRVVVNQSVELTPEDIAQAKAAAMQIVIEESKEDAKKIVAETIELTDEDRAEARKLVIEKFAESEREKMLKKASKVKKDVQPEVQSSLFD